MADKTTMIVSNDKEHGEAIIRASGCRFKYDAVNTPVISRVDRDGALLGGVIYANYTGSSIEMHTAGVSPHWVNKDLLWVAFHYPFEQLSCRRVFAFVKAKNLKALAFIHKLGFTPIAALPDYYRDSDRLILSMEPNQCRWLALRPRNLKDNLCG